MTRSCGAGVLSAVALILLEASARAEDPPTAEPLPHGWAAPQFRLGAELRIGRTDNLYHAQARREAEFDTETGPYERYHRMKGPGDTEARLALDLSWRFKHASKRAIGLRFRSRQFAYLDNEIANHEDFLLDATFNVSKPDRLRLRVEYAPEHFRKNLKNEAFPGITVFERADARETGLSLEYERELGKVWSAAVSVGQGRRDYTAPFDGRDEHRDSWSIGVKHELTKRVGLELSLGSESTDTPTSVEVGVPKNRSHDDDVATLGIDLNLRHGWRVRQSSTYRVRDYTTKEPLDTTRLGRTDRRWTLGVDVEKKLTDHWSLAFDAARTDNDAGRQTVTTDDDQFGFKEFDVGVSVAFER